VFFAGSRYAGIEELERTDANGRVLRYVAIRLTPDTPAAGALVVEQGDRLDRLAHRAFRDPERFWRICDANHALWPDDLLAEPGRALLIPPAEG
jgi:hypothetical protein